LTAKADRVLLRAALENLLGNAWKYTARKDTAVISVGEKVVDGDQAFFIADNGAGFDMAHADKLFEPFQRLHRIDEFEGNGIGLTTVKRIIRHHGGKVWAEAEVDKGATFYFTIGQVENYETAAPQQ
jgi:light-regulated signal transduction histidine kinase (bacteriophytochrome)